MNLVLLVEEDETIAQEIGQMLVGEGYDVVTAKDLSQARACMEVAHFDMVISANQIPELEQEVPGEPFASNTGLFSAAARLPPRI